MFFSAFLYFFYPSTVARAMAAALELLQWNLNNDGFSSTDKPSILSLVPTNKTSQKMQFSSLNSSNHPAHILLVVL
jgi:hypothetical protein